MLKAESVSREADNAIEPVPRDYTKVGGFQGSVVPEAAVSKSWKSGRRRLSVILFLNSSTCFRKNFKKSVES